MHLDVKVINLNQNRLLSSPEYPLCNSIVLVLQLWAAEKMLKILYSTIKWNLKLGKELLFNYPFFTSSTIMLTLVAQVSTLLSFLLPIQIVVIAGTGKISRRIPNIFGDLEINSTVLVLSFLTLFFVIMQMVAQNLAAKAAYKGANYLLAKHDKLVIFEAQNEIAENCYKRYCEAVSGLLFFSLAICVILYLYPEVVFSLTMFYISSLIILETTWKLNKDLQKSLLENAAKHFKTLTILSFLVIFTYIIIDFLHYSPPSFVAAILTLLMFRQINARLNVAFSHLCSIRQNANQINSIFFRDSIYSIPDKTKRMDIWAILDSPNFEDELFEAVNNIIQPEMAPGSIRWIETGVNNVSSFTISSPEHSYSTLLVKLFSRTQYASATHESTLLGESPLDLPAPTLLGTTDMNGFHLHIFDISATTPCSRETYKEIEPKVKAAITSTVIANETRDRYLRSKHLLYDRLHQEIFDHLKMVANPKQHGLLLTCKQRLDSIQEILRELPTTLSVATSSENVRITSDGNPVVMHWGQWNIDVAGIIWISNNINNDEITAFVKNTDLNSFKNIRQCDKKMMLAALIYRAEKEYIRQYYLTCINTWEQIIEFLSENCSREKDYE